MLRRPAAGATTLGHTSSTDPGGTSGTVAIATLTATPAQAGIIVHEGPRIAASPPGPTVAARPPGPTAAAYPPGPTAIGPDT